MEPIALYIHIPFCRTKCPYCDFNTYAGILPLLPRYLEALCLDLALWGEALGHPPVRTVFLGGGTPSLLSPQQMVRLLEEVRRAFPLQEGAEVTAEANPDDVTRERLEGFREAGVNRLSLGVQSLDDGLLRLLGRRHPAEKARQAYREARRAGFANINLDLMYGIPHQTLRQWHRTLQEAVALGPEHLSCYCLTLEEGTPLEGWVREGRLPAPDPDLAAEMYERAEEVLEEAGYRHYEISNWARPGLESRHNLTYWRNGPYLGVGPGAHSFLRGHRFAVVRSPLDYIRGVQEWARRDGRGTTFPPEGAPLEEVEPIDRATEMAETVILGLRLEEGLSAEAFSRRFGLSLLEVYASVIGDLEGAGLLEVHRKGEEVLLRLTRRGRLLSNEVFCRFLQVSLPR